MDGKYRRAWLNGDAIAGLTTAAVVIPKAQAYATIAGLPVQVGLYTVMVPMASAKNNSKTASYDFFCVFRSTYNHGMRRAKVWAGRFFQKPETTKP